LLKDKRKTRPRPGEPGGTLVHLKRRRVCILWRNREY
jgi:hypothetical protein